MYRLDNGQPIRDAMKAANLSIGRLSDKTKEVDPAGFGISPSSVGTMVSKGASGRDRHELRSAGLVAKALNEPLENFFSRTPL